MTDESARAARQSPSSGERPLDESRLAIADMLKRLSLGTHYDDERREHTRYPIAVPVSVIPLSSDLCATGGPLAMMTMNISLGGAALIYKDDCEAPLVALNFAPADVECAPIVLRIMRRSRIGPLHVIAGEFNGTWRGLSPISVR